MANLIGGAVAVPGGILFLPMAVAPVAKKFGKKRNASHMQVVAADGARILIGTKDWIV